MEQVNSRKTLSDTGRSKERSLWRTGPAIMKRFDVGIIVPIVLRLKPYAKEIIKQITKLREVVRWNFSESENSYRGGG